MLRNNQFHGLLGFIFSWFMQYSIAQDIGQEQAILPPAVGITLTNWKYSPGDDPVWAQKEYDDSHWKIIKINEPLNKSNVDYNNRFWLRTVIEPEHIYGNGIVALLITQFGASEIYINGRLIKSLGTIASRDEYKGFNPHNYPIPVILQQDYQNVIAIRFATNLPASQWVMSRSNVPLITVEIQQLEIALNNYKEQNKISPFQVGFGFISGILCLLFLLLYLYFPHQLLFLFFGLFNLGLVLINIEQAYLVTGQYDLTVRAYLISAMTLLSRFVGMNILLFMLYALKRIRPIFWMYVGFMILIDFPLTVLLPVEYLFISAGFRSIIIVISAWIAYHAFTSKDRLDWLVGILACAAILVNLSFALHQFANIDFTKYIRELVAPILTTVAIAIYLALLYSRINKSLEVQLIQVRQLSEENLIKEIEKQDILAAQAVELEKQVNQRTAELEEQKSAVQTTLDELKATQSQLIQSEKMASLGQLTAGIAHEIQNPLNFVTNFSEVSAELVEEIEGERGKKQDERDEILVSEILRDIKENIQKINFHGKRADSIVKGMLEHSRPTTGEKVLTDINILADEYLRLSYHGMRAKNKNFQADFGTYFDPNLPKVKVVPKDIGRVLLNIINNAFQACENLETKSQNANYKPIVTISTKNMGDKIEISIADNGHGIPDSIKDKIFQPFFTTKPTGEGTGLGLSLSYEIVSAHGGEINIDSTEGEGAIFSILLPVGKN